MPNIGLGTYQMRSKEVAAAVDCALTVGYKHIDTAASYRNESSVGEALQDHLKSGKLKRKDIFVTSKLPNYSLDSEKAMQEEIEKSLDSLQLTHLDMYLVHMPWGSQLGPNGERIPTRQNSVEKTWRMMEKFHREGKTKAIGLSNFSIRLMDRVLSAAKIFPENVQFECHAYHQQSDIRAYCQKKNLAMTAYAPLGAPGLPERYKMHCKNAPLLLQDERLLSIAEEIRRTPAQVLLAHVMALGCVPLPKSADLRRIEENLKATEITLSDSHMKTLAGLDSGIKYFVFHWAEGHYEYLDEEAY